MSRSAGIESYFKKKRECSDIYQGGNGLPTKYMRKLRSEWYNILPKNLMHH